MNLLLLLGGEVLVGFYVWVWFCVSIMKKDCVFSSHSKNHVNVSKGENHSGSVTVGVFHSKA